MRRRPAHLVWIAQRSFRVVRDLLRWGNLTLDILFAIAIRIAIISIVGLLVYGYLVHSK